jgi:hypothetical protein
MISLGDNRKAGLRITRGLLLHYVSPKFAAFLQPKVAEVQWPQAVRGDSKATTQRTSQTPITLYEIFRAEAGCITFPASVPEKKL